MTKAIRFAQIKTVEQMQTRIDNGFVSVGRYWPDVKPLFDEIGPAEREVTLSICMSGGGKRCIKRYLKAAQIDTGDLK